MIFESDQEVFDEPTGWQGKPFTQSSLIRQFPDIWSSIKIKLYQRALRPGVFGDS